MLTMLDTILTSYQVRSKIAFPVILIHLFPMQFVQSQDIIVANSNQIKVIRLLLHGVHLI